MPKNAPTKGDVAPTDKYEDSSPHPVYNKIKVEGKAPSNRKATHK